MHSIIHLAATAFLASSAAAAILRVNVGDSGLAFNPESIVAAVGDVVEYHFYTRNHSVVQGDFSVACSTGSIQSPFYSGFIPSSSGEAANVFQVTIKDTNPMWFYCSQNSHCQSGMVGVINPPASGNTLAAYKAAALASTGDSVSPKVVSGGVVGPAAVSSSKVSSTPATTAAATMPSSTASSKVTSTMNPTVTSSIMSSTTAPSKSSSVPSSAIITPSSSMSSSTTSTTATRSATASVATTNGGESFSETNFAGMVYVGIASLFAAFML